MMGSTVGDIARAMYARVDELFNATEDSQKMNTRESVLALMELNILTGAKYVCLGPDMGMEVEEYCDFHEGFIVSAADLYEGELLVPPSRAHHYRDIHPKIKVQYLQFGADAELHTITSSIPSEPLVQREYLGILEWMSPGCTVIGDSNKVATTKNATYYGYVTHNGKIYEPGLSPWHLKGRADLRGLGKYGIGFEVEKEDEDILDTISSEFLEDTTGWVGEEDGSLDAGGYELISPCYNMLSKARITKDILSLQCYIDDAGEGSRCGGHINISQRDLAPVELAKALRGYASLLYAMYPERCGNTFSRAKRFSEYLEEAGNDEERYTVFNLCSDRLELRIFPEVYSAQTLLDRYELVKYMMLHKTKRTETVAGRLLNPQSELSLLVKELGYAPEALCQVMIQQAEYFDAERFTAHSRKIFLKKGITFQLKTKLSAKDVSQHDRLLKAWLAQIPAQLGDAVDEGLSGLQRNVRSYVNRRRRNI